MAAKKAAKPEKAPVQQNPEMEGKLKALEHALSDLDKQYGKGAVAGAWLKVALEHFLQPALHVLAGDVE